MTTQAASSNFDPMNIPTDPDALMAHAMKLGEMMGEGDVSTTTVADGDADAKAAAEAQAKADADAKAAADAKAKEEAEAKAAAEAKEVKDGGTPATEKVDGVLAKDGKNVIPFSVLEEARQKAEAERVAHAEALERATKAERELAEMRAAQAQVASSKRVDDLKAELAEIEKDIADAKALEEKDVPEITRPMMRTLERQKRDIEDRIKAESDAAAKQAEDAKREAQEREERDRTTTLEAEQAKANEAVEGNPTLRYWREKNPAMFDLAAVEDERLRGERNAEYMAMSYADRFAHVVAGMEKRYGKAEIPAEFLKPASSGKGETKETGGIKSMTLSDLPGGAPPAQGDARIENMSNFEIGRHVNRLMDKGILDPMALVHALDQPVSV